MKVLLLGANGQVGSACAEHFQSLLGIEVVLVDRQLVDFSVPESVSQYITREVPDCVVNAVAYTAVDKAESELEQAKLVNCDSVAAMAQACAELSVPVIHLSTDYVFDGRAKLPYSEELPTAPLGVYGQTKLAGEQALLASGATGLILRTSWVFGVRGANFVKTMLRLAKDRDELGIVADQVGRPTYAGLIAHVIGRLLMRLRDGQPLPQGVYHCTGGGEVCSWYDFTRAIFSTAEQLAATRQLELAINLPKLNPITTEDYPTPAARPQYSVLNCAKLEGLLGEKLPDWQVGLADMLSQSIENFTHRC